MGRERPGWARAQVCSTALCASQAVGAVHGRSGGYGSVHESRNGGWESLPLTSYTSVGQLTMSDDQMVRREAKGVKGGAGAMPICGAATRLSRARPPGVSRGSAPSLGAALRDVLTERRDAGTKCVHVALSLGRVSI